jgi:hypothetical protein
VSSSISGQTNSNRPFESEQKHFRRFESEQKQILGSMNSRQREAGKLKNGLFRVLGPDLFFFETVTVFVQKM